jgi:hypothetical protein
VERILVTELPDEQALGSWTIRRLFMFGTIAFCMGCVLYVMVNDRKGGVNEMSVVMAFGTIATTLGSYVFGATWEHVSAMRTARQGRNDYYHRNSDYRVDDPDA